MPGGVERIYEFFEEKSNFYFIVEPKLICASGGGESARHFALRVAKRVIRTRKCISRKHRGVYRMVCNEVRWQEEKSRGNADQASPRQKIIGATTS